MVFSSHDLCYWPPGRQMHRFTHKVMENNRDITTAIM